jgi:hypothetical protein
VTCTRDRILAAIEPCVVHPYPVNGATVWRPLQSPLKAKGMSREWAPSSLAANGVDDLRDDPDGEPCECKRCEPDHADEPHRQNAWVTPLTSAPSTGQARAPWAVSMPHPVPHAIANASRRDATGASAVAAQASARRRIVHIAASPGPADRAYPVNGTTVWRWRPRPSISSSITSPAFRYCGGFITEPTPGGVPVVTTSPGSSTQNCVM